MASKHTFLEDKLWDRWLKTNEENAANELIEHYMYLVHFHAERIATNLPRTVTHEELISFGLLGLFDAIKKFDIDRNLKFDTYASFRIRGAIIDGLRREDWLSRTMREKAKKVTEASDQLEQELQRTPTSEEIANRLNMSVEEVETSVKDALLSNVLSMDDEASSNGRDYQEGIGYTIKDNSTVSPEESIIEHELNTELAHSLQSLNENEQMVVSLFYYNELTLTEIGKIMELTTSRISQIHKSAIFKLRNTLRKIV